MILQYIYFFDNFILYLISINYILVHYIFFLFRFAQTWRETDSNKKYTWLSKRVIIKCVIIPVSHHLTMGIQPFTWYDSAYLWSPMIVSGFDHISWVKIIAIITHVIIKKCDHILWSYKDVNKITGSDHRNTWLILSCQTCGQILRSLQPCDRDLSPCCNDF